VTPLRRIAFAALLIIGFYGVWGIGWGLPSVERTNLFLSPSSRNPEFFSAVMKARDDLYDKMGGTPIAYMGRLLKKREANTLPTLMNSYSSFLLKTHSIDESATLVMLSNINPLQNRWYPNSFIYGGAYLYPLGAYLGAAHVLHLIRLTASPMYYFIHPMDIAHVYIAMRFWSVLGLLTASYAVFSLGQRLLGPSAASWAMIFFGLSPVCLAHAKFSKPHVWAAAMTLWATDFALQSKQHRRQVLLIAAGIFAGFGAGMAVTQVAYIPILLWAAWTEDWGRSLKNGFFSRMPARCRTIHIYPPSMPDFCRMPF